MRPTAGVGAQRRARIEPAQLVEERLRLVLLIPDDAIPGAPPDLEGYTAERDPPGLAEPAPGGVGTVVRLRVATDLAAHGGLENRAVALAPAPKTAPRARELRQLAVAAREIGHRVQRSCAGQEPWMPRNEQQRLLSTHATAEREDPRSVDPEPRQRSEGEVGHLREVVDLAAVAVREAF